MEQTTTQKQAAVGKHGLSISRYTLAEGTAALAAQVKKERAKNKGAFEGVGTTLDYKTFHESNRVNSKMVGVFIGSKIHYLDRSYNNTDELASILLPLGIELSGDNHWGVGAWRDTAFDFEVMYFKSANKKPFDKNAGFYDGAAWFDTSCGKLEWSVEAPQEKYPYLVPSSTKSDTNTVEVIINSGVSLCVAGTDLVAFKNEFDALVRKYFIQE